LVTFDHFDQDELLAFIEGELEPDEAARLEHELSNSPRAAMQVERMRRDRELLRTEREPDMPRNFLPSIESRLARPMLMESLHEAEQAEIAEAFASAPGARPGVMRRQHRRKLLRTRLNRFATAAVIVLVAGTGVWTVAVVTNLTERTSGWIAAMRSPIAANPQDSEYVALDQHPNVQNDTSAAKDDVAWPPGAIVHHAPPRTLRVDDADLLAHNGLARNATPDRAPQFDVLLVIRADHPDAFETMMRQFVAALDTPAALVQNFSYDEATRLAEAWARTQALRPDRRDARPPSIAGVNGEASAGNERLSRLADEARQQLRQTRGGRAIDEVEQSRQLTGPRELAATFAEQLDFSSRGATHTITITADRLHDLLAALNRAAQGEAMLAPLPEPERASEFSSQTAQQVWLTHRRELQRVASELDRIAPDSLIHLPVRVERRPMR
jgi:anti-sigma factor RsiW